MYVHKSCKASEEELDFEKKAGGICASCEQSGTIYHVKGTTDYYEHILNSVLYQVTDGLSFNPMAGENARQRELNARVKAARKGENWTTPEEEGAFAPPEPELAEEDEALAEVIEEAVEAEIEAAVPEEREPEETELEAENKRLKEELAETVEARTLIEDIPEGFLEDEKDTEIARLEAELAELKK